MSELIRISKISGRPLPLRGNDIDTDRIIPARFLRSITFDGMEQHVFEDDRKNPGGPYNRHPFDVKHFQGAAVLLVNSNFGCGSSREHAPQALQRWGIQVVVGESFAEIFFGNSTMIGMPCVTASAADVATLMDVAEREPATGFAVDLVAGTCRAGQLTVPVSLPPKVRQAFTSGAWDTTGMLLDHFDDVRAAGCSMCLGMNPDKLVGDQVCASSSNRNFKGRQGSPTGRTLLMSPAMVAAAAVAGEVVDVRELLEEVHA